MHPSPAEEITMWIYLNDAFLSIVADLNHEDALLVRARRRGDIEAAFPAAEVTETPDADYQFRTVLLREYVAGVLVKRLLAIDYPNFKSSIRGGAAAQDRHDAYLSVWSTTRNRLTADPKPKASRPAWLGGQDRSLPFPPTFPTSRPSGPAGTGATVRGENEGNGGASPFGEDEAIDRWDAELPDAALTAGEGWRLCTACAGRGSYQHDPVGDGLGGEMLTCEECNGTGVEPGQDEDEEDAVDVPFATPFAGDGELDQDGEMVDAGPETFSQLIGQEVM